VLDGAEGVEDVGADLVSCAQEEVLGLGGGDEALGSVEVVAGVIAEAGGRVASEVGEPLLD
jgi:hypothetical protein